MLRRIAMGLLFVGAVSGYAHGFRTVRERHMAQRRAAIEQFSQACAQSAVSAYQRQQATAVQAAPSTVTITVAAQPAQSR
ncbi:MAG: hypothetical protein U0269_33250 [Polyangiales bacterium]